MSPDNKIPSYKGPTLAQPEGEPTNPILERVLKAARRRYGPEATPLVEKNPYMVLEFPNSKNGLDAIVFIGPETEGTEVTALDRTHPDHVTIYVANQNDTGGPTDKIEYSRSGLTVEFNPVLPPITRGLSINRHFNHTISGSSTTNCQLMTSADDRLHITHSVAVICTETLKDQLTSYGKYKNLIIPVDFLSVDGLA